MTVLKTERLTLRRAQDSDFDGLFPIFSDPDAMAYWATPPQTDPERTRERITLMAARPEPLTYFVIDMDGRAIGTAGMHRDGEVGFILHPDYWRRGIVTEAMKAIIVHVFANTDVPELTADVDPRNIASAACLRGLGFHETHYAENTFLIDGVWSHSQYYALPRPNAL